MCIAAWVWQAHPVYQLFLLLNRDEFHDRPTKPVEWWGEGSNQKILGGRDELGGGTWLGCTKDGFLAFLTNFREPEPSSGTRSRGELPKRFLEGTKSASETAEEIVKEAHQYDGFNLILAELQTKTMFYISNRPKGKPIFVQKVPPGVHVLSNANLNSPWPKAEKLRRELYKILVSYGETKLCEKDMVEKLMGDKTKADRSMLPTTGCDPEREFDLSSIFVEINAKSRRYGTRSMAAVSVKTNDEVAFYEKYLENNNWREHLFQYHMQSSPIDQKLAK
ncbi:transport and Golgi organization 2 homolog [Zingiber officinale]|uniref:transport and Golgi organization 2 homolog n=1 Tax=Zingiber officinale TaxID=94328 RepID=UPI001C4B5551|nr:transport and Golgi organization 2 homolog [Zingiber officinale]